MNSSLCKNNGKITYEDRKKGNTIPFLESMDHKVFGKMRRRYSKMIA